MGLNEVVTHVCTYFHSGFLPKSLSFWEQNTNRCVDEVQEVLLTLVAVKQRGCLGLHCYPPLSLHLKLVQHLLVLLSLCYGTCLTSISDTLCSD